MKKIMTFVAIATLAAFCLACSKGIDNPVTNQPQEKTAIEGSTVYLNIGLSEDTKISHDLDGTTIKPRWESTDALKVTFTVSTTPVEETFNIDASSISADGRSARFYKDDSQLASRDGNFDVAYAGNATDWSVQDGTYANLPEVLAKTGLSSIDSPIALESQLTYFHFDLSTAATPTEALELANAYFYNNTHALIIDSSNNTGDIKITRTMTYTIGGVGANADFYVAAKLAADSNGDTFGIDLQNGDHYAGVQGYSLTWNAAKSYSTGAVYKKTSTVENLVYNTGLLGATDNSQDWWGAVKTVSLAPDKRVNMKFINYGKGDDNWNNWHIAIDDYDPSWWLAADLAADRRIRTGNSWDPYNMVFNFDIFLNQNGNPVIDWANFNANQNGARVDVTVDHSSSGYVFADATVTSADDANVFRETYGTTASKTMNLNVTLTTVMSHYILKSIAITDIPAADKVTSVTATATAKVEGAADKIILSPYSMKVTDNNAKVYNGSSHEFTVRDEIVLTTAPNTATVHFRGNNITTNCNVTKVATSVLADAGITSLVADGFTAHNAEDRRWTVAAGESQTIKKTVTAKESTPKVYHCPFVEIWDTEWNTCYGDAGMHNGFWGTGLVAECMKKSTNWVDDDDIIAALKATPTVYVTVSNDGNGQASIRYYVEYTKDATNYTRYNYYENIVVPVGDFKFCLASEQCTLTF